MTFLFFSTLRRPLRSTLFPYTTLFRSFVTRSKTTPSELLSILSFQSRARRSRVARVRSEEHTSELQSRGHLVCRLLLEKKKKLIYTLATSISRITFPIFDTLL